MRIKQRSKALLFACFYNIDETRLKVVHSGKDLGIIFDDNLHFEEHIAAIVTNSRSYEQIQNLVYIHRKTSPGIWSPCLNSYHKRIINKLENVRRRATKLIPGFANISYKDRLKSLQLPMAYRRYRGDMIELYKMTHHLYDTNATNGFLRFRTSRARGHNFNIAKETCKSDIKRYSFRHRTTDQWNNLPWQVIKAPSLNEFKRQIDLLWKKNDVMFDPDIDIQTRTSWRGTRYMTY